MTLKFLIWSLLKKKKEKAEALNPDKTIYLTPFLVWNKNIATLIKKIKKWNGLFGEELWKSLLHGEGALRFPREKLQGTTEYSVTVFPKFRAIIDEFMSKAVATLCTRNFYSPGILLYSVHKICVNELVKGRPWRWVLIFINAVKQWRRAFRAIIGSVFEMVAITFGPKPRTKRHGLSFLSSF